MCKCNKNEQNGHLAEKINFLVHQCLRSSKKYFERNKRIYSGIVRVHEHCWLVTVMTALHIWNWMLLIALSRESDGMEVFSTKDSS